MKQNDGNRNDHATLIMENQPSPQVSAPTAQSDVEVKTELSTRTKLRARQKIQQNRFVIVAAGAVVFALLIFAVVSAPHCRCLLNFATEIRHSYPRSVIKYPFDFIRLGLIAADGAHDLHVGDLTLRVYLVIISGHVLENRDGRLPFCGSIGATRCRGHHVFGYAPAFPWDVYRKRHTSDGHSYPLCSQRWMVVCNVRAKGSIVTENY
jgi:hypothetical protein